MTIPTNITFATNVTFVTNVTIVTNVTTVALVTQNLEIRAILARKFKNSRTILADFQTVCFKLEFSDCFSKPEAKKSLRTDEYSSSFVP